MKQALLMITMIMTVTGQPWRVTDLPDPSNREVVRATVVASAVENLYQDTDSMKLTETGVIYRGKALVPDSLHARMLEGFYGDSLQEYYIGRVKYSLWSVFDLAYLSWKKFADKEGPKRRDCMEWLDTASMDLGLEEVSDLKKYAKEELRDWRRSSKSSNASSPISR